MTGSSSNGVSTSMKVASPLSDKKKISNTGGDDTKITTNSTTYNDTIVDQGKWTIDVPSSKTDSASTSSSSSSAAAAAALLPSIGLVLRFTVSISIALYILNQKHLLPQPLSSIVSRVLFWPTLPITVSKRYHTWYTPIDDTVIMGGAPFGFTNIPETLYQQYNVRGVINLCEEYRGPVRTYNQLGIRQLYLPTTDHFEPSIQSMKDAIEFIIDHQQRKECVYVHCRAGHGRSAAIVFIWLLLQRINNNNDHNNNKYNNNIDPQSIDLQKLNEELCQLRNVRKTLYQQPNILQFYSMLLEQYNNKNNNEQGIDSSDNHSDDDDDDDDDVDVYDDKDQIEQLVEEYDDNDNYSNSNSAYNDNDDYDTSEDVESELYSFKNIEDEL